MEAEIGVLRTERKDAQQGAVLREWLNGTRRRFSFERVLGVSEPIALEAERLHVPNKMEASDALIAATAIVHGFTLATRNVRDVRTAGLKLLDPWSA